MSQFKADIEIGMRMFEEAERLFQCSSKAAKELKVDYKTVDGWANGSTPTGLSLARLHHAGGDVIYVLSGKRGKEYGK